VLGQVNAQFLRAKFNIFAIDPRRKGFIFPFAFEGLVPIGKNSGSSTIQNANLRRTRDLLLPRLVNGEVDVSGLEIVAAAESNS
jgi:hypothetical protein